MAMPLLPPNMEKRMKFSILKLMDKVDQSIKDFFTTIITPWRYNMPAKKPRKKSSPALAVVPDTEAKLFTNVTPAKLRKLKKAATIVLEKASPYQIGMLDKLEQNLNDTFHFEAAEYVAEYAPGLPSFQFTNQLIAAFRWDETCVDPELWGEIYWELVSVGSEYLHSAVYQTMGPEDRNTRLNLAKESVNVFNTAGKIN